MPSAADLAMGATYALLNANLNKIHVPSGFEVPLGVANPSSNEAIFSQECNEAIHTALLNQGLQLMPLASADIAIVYALDEMDALQAVIDFRNRSSQEQPPVILPVVVLTPTILRYEWGLWSVSETISSFNAEELLLLSAQPVYHASPFASQTRSYWDPDRFGNITSSVVDVSMEVIEDVAREVVSHFNSGDESMFLGEWESLAVGPVGWMTGGFCGQGLREVYLPNLKISGANPGRIWPTDGSLMKGSTSMLGSCGAPKLFPPHHRGVAFMYSGFIGTEFPNALRDRFHHVTVNGRRLHAQLVPDGYNPGVTASNIRRGLSTHPPILGVTGVFGTPTAEAAAAELASFEENSGKGPIPYFGPLTGSSLLRHPYRRNIINTRASMRDEAHAMVSALQEWGRLRVAALYMRTSFGIGGIEAVNASLLEFGGVLLGFESAPRFSSASAYTDAMDRLQSTLSGEVPEAFIIWDADGGVLAYTSLIRERYGSEPIIMVTSTGGGDAAMNGLTQSGMQRGVYFARSVLPLTGATRTSWITQEGILTADIVLQAMSRAFEKLDASVQTDPTITPLEMMRPVEVLGDAVIDPFETEVSNTIELLREELIDAIYFQRFFSSSALDSRLVLGPFSESCNQATQVVHITGIDGSGNDDVVFESETVECSDGDAKDQWTVHVGATLPLTGARAIEAQEVARGLQAAAHALNGDQRIPGFSIDVIVVDDGGEIPNALENLEFLAHNHSIAALLTPLGANVVDALLPVCSEHSLPIFGALSGAKIIRQPYNPMFVNIRAAIQDEIQLIINHAMEASNTRVALIFPDDVLGAEVFASLEISLGNQGLRIHALVEYDVASVKSAELVNRLRDASGITPPQALICVTDEKTTASIVHKLRELWPSSELAVYTLASLHTETYLELLDTSTASIYQAGMVPHPQSSSEAATAYRQHLQVSCGSECKPSFIGLEAFIALMAFGEAVRQTDPRVIRSLNQPLATEPTRDKNRHVLVNTIYDMGLINVYDLRLGPYGPACENDVGCSCNQGARKVFLYEAITEHRERLVLIEGQLQPIPYTVNSWKARPDDTLYFDTCGVPSEALPVDQRPIVFGQSVDLTTVAGKALAAGVRLAFAHMNRLGGVRGRGLRLVSYDDAGNGTLAAANARDIMERHGVFGFIGFGGLYPETVIQAFKYVTATYPTVPFVGGECPSVLLRNPVTPTSITVASSLQEEAAAAVMFARSLGRTKIAIIHEETLAGEDASESMAKAVSFYRADLVAVSNYYVGRSTAMAVVDLLTASPPPDVVLFYGDTVSFCNILESYYDALGYTAAAPPVDSSDSVLFIGMSVVSPLKTRQLLPLSFQHSAFVTSGIPTAWQPLPILNTLIADLSADPYGDTFSIFLEEGTRMFSAYIAARLAALVLERAPAVSRQGFVDTLYATQLFSVEGLQLGPYYYNHIGGGSDCSMGLRKATVESILSFSLLGRPGYRFYSNYTLDMSNSLECGVYTDFSRPPCDVGFERVYTSNETEAFYCRECARGFYSADGLHCSPCPPGSFSTSSGSSGCTLCPPGHYQDRTEQSQCLPCDTSSYASGYGNAACSACGRNALTRSTASTSPSACVCLGGYYGNALAESTSTNTGCRVCPEGGNCCAYPVKPDGSVRPEEWMRRTNSSFSLDVCDLGVTVPVPLPGYVESTVIVGGIVKCRSESACVGVLDYSARNESSRCSPGYGGLHCGNCDTGYYRFYGECLSCGTNTVQYFRVTGMVIFFTVLILTSVEFSARKSTYSGLSLLLNFLQIMGLMNDFWMVWPSMLQSFVGFSALVNLQLDLFAPECKLQDLFPADFYERLTMWLTLPLLLLLCYVVTFFVAISIVYSLQSCFATRKKRRERRERRGSVSLADDSKSVSSISRSTSSKLYNCCGKRCSRHAVHRFLGVSRLYSMDLASTIKVFRSAYFRVIVAIYPVLLSRSLSMFRCVNLDDGVSVLEGYYSELCYEDRWWSNIHLGILGTIIYGAGMPTLLFVVLYRARKDRIKREVRRRARQFYASADGKDSIPSEAIACDSSDSDIDQHFVKRVPSKFDLRQAKKEAASVATFGLVGHYHSIWPFVIDYHPHAWYWSLMEQLEFIGIVAASTFVQLPTAQLLLALLTVGAFSVAMLVVKPYAHRVFNNLEVINDLVQVALLMIGISFVNSPPTASESTLNGFSVMLLSFVGIAIILGFVADLRQKVIEWKRSRSFAVVKSRKDWVSERSLRQSMSAYSHTSKVAPEITVGADLEPVVVVTGSRQASKEEDTMGSLPETKTEGVRTRNTAFDRSFSTAFVPTRPENLTLESMASHVSAFSDRRKNPASEVPQSIDDRSQIATRRETGGSEVASPNNSPHQEGGSNQIDDVLESRFLRMSPASEEGDVEGFIQRLTAN